VSGPAAALQSALAGISEKKLHAGDTLFVNDMQVTELLPIPVNKLNSK
jgi:hypothetical protein